MKIYTKTGDDGKTSLVGGQRVSKCCDRLESYGTIDELNSFMGLLITQCSDEADKTFLTTQQNTLFVVGGYLATDNTINKVRERNIVTNDMIDAVEQEIDRIDALLPPLRLFILPGGTQAAATAHVCRTICRRAERCIYRLREGSDTPANQHDAEIEPHGAEIKPHGAEIDPHVTAYINRLSDYFFILARKLNLDAGVEDIIFSAPSPCRR